MVFVYDIDGTLLNDDELLTDENKKAVIESEKHGLVIFASGRMLRSILKFLNEHFEKEYPVIAYNGAVVYVPSEGIVYEEGIDDVTTEKIIQDLKKEGIHRQIYVNDELVVEEDNEEVRGYAKHSGVDYRVVDDLVKFVKGKKSTKILAISEPLILDRIKESLSPKYPDLRIFKSFPIYLDFVPKNVSKSKALELLAKKLGFKLSEVIAFGDNDNDADLLSAVGLGVAMANGTSRAKEAAKVVAPSNNDSGVAKVVFDILSSGNSYNIRLEGT